MVTITVARETTYQSFVTSWGATSAYTFGNEKYTPPVDLPWVRLAMQHQTGSQDSLGGVGIRKFSRQGLVTIQVFVPQDSGMAAMDTLVTAARAIFEGATIGTIRFTSASVQEIGPSDGWYQTNVDIEFTYYETK